jgi:hypothetical protein
MVVIIHQAIGVDFRFPETDHLDQNVEKALVSFVFEEDTGGIGRGFMT